MGKTVKPSLPTTDSAVKTETYPITSDFLGILDYI